MYHICYILIPLYSIPQSRFKHSLVTSLNRSHDSLVAVAVCQISDFNNFSTAYPLKAWGVCRCTLIAKMVCGLRDYTLYGMKLMAGAWSMVGTSWLTWEGFVERCVSGWLDISPTIPTKVGIAPGSLGWHHRIHQYDRVINKHCIIRTVRTKMTQFWLLQWRSITNGTVPEHSYIPSTLLIAL